MSHHRALFFTPFHCGDDPAHIVPSIFGRVRSYTDQVGGDRFEMDHP
jgi:hypothetical protein